MTLSLILKNSLGILIKKNLVSDCYNLDLNPPQRFAKPVTPVVAWPHFLISSSVAVWMHSSSWKLPHRVSGALDAPAIAPCVLTR